jgi:hypothetical protein
MGCRKIVRERALGHDLARDVKSIGGVEDFDAFQIPAGTRR